MKKMLLPKKSKTVYDLEEDDDYWFIDDYSGNICLTTWNNHFIDDRLLQIGNIFPTEEEAQFELERRKVIAELKRYSIEFKYKFNNYYIRYNFDENGVDIALICRVKSNEIYFESVEKAQEAINSVGEDRVIKYYLGIKK